MKAFRRKFWMPFFIFLVGEHVLFRADAVSHVIKLQSFEIWTYFYDKRGKLGYVFCEKQAINDQSIVPLKPAKMM